MDDEKRKPVQINFRADPDLKERLDQAVFDHSVRTGRRRLTLNEVLVDLVEAFVDTEESLRKQAGEERTGG